MYVEVDPIFRDDLEVWGETAKSETRIEDRGDGGRRSVVRWLKGCLGQVREA